MFVRIDALSGYIELKTTLFYSYVQCLVLLTLFGVVFMKLLPPPTGIQARDQACTLLLLHRVNLTLQSFSRGARFSSSFDLT